MRKDNPGKRCTIAVAGVLLASCGQFASAAQAVSVNFNNHPAQVYTGKLLQQDWPGLVWDGTRNRARIIADNTCPTGQYLRMSYPAGSVGPLQGGGQFLVKLPPADEYFLSYRVRFQPGFDFAKGGKLPGLASGDAKYSNGHKPYNGDGWTARLMWVEQGKLVPYLYYVGMPAERKFGDFWPMGISAKPGEWMQITQQVRLNSPGKKNGIYAVWVNGRPVTRRTDMEWRWGNKGQIDTFYFSTYYGGNTPDWAPHWNCFADFDDFRISRQMPRDILRAGKS